MRAGPSLVCLVDGRDQRRRIAALEVYGYSLRILTHPRDGRRIAARKYRAWYEQG
jgi:hypothetical protein